MRLIDNEAEQLREKLKQIEHIKEELARTDVNTLDPDKAEKYRTIMTKIEQEEARVKTQLLSLERQRQQEIDKTAQKEREAAEAARAEQEAIQRQIQQNAQQAYSRITTGANQLNTALNQAVRLITLLETAFLRVTTSAVKTGAEFEAQMSQVAATLNLDQVINQQESAFARLRDTAIQYGKETTYTASQVADALNQLALSGMSAKESMEALPQVLTLAKAGSMDVDQAATIVAASMSALELSSSEVNTLMDQMARTAQKSKVTVSQVGSTILDTAAAFNLAGQDMSTMNAIIGTLGNRFKNIEDQSKTLRTTLNRVSTYAGDLKELGVEVEDGTGHIRDFIDIFNDLRIALEDKTDTERTSILTKIFGNRGYTYVAYLMQATKGDLQALKYEIENSDGAAKAMSDTMTDNLQSDFIILKSAVESLSISITEKLNPSLRDATQQGTAGINKLTDEVESGRLGKSFEKLGDTVEVVVEKAINAFIKYGPTVIDVLTKILEHADRFIQLFAINKVTRWTTNLGAGIANVTSGISTLSTAMQDAAANGTRISDELGQSAATVSANIITSATTAAAAVGTLIASLIDAKANQIDVEADNLGVADDETQAILDKSKKLRETYAEQRAEREKEIAGIQESNKEYQALAERLEELAGQETRTAAEQNELYAIMNKLNAEIPGLNLNFDEQTNSLSKTKAEIRELINNYSEYLELVASRAYAEEIATQKVKYELDEENLREQLKQLESDRQAAYDEFYRLQDQNGITGAGRLSIKDNYTKDELELYYNKYGYVMDDILAAQERYRSANQGWADTEGQLIGVVGTISHLDDQLESVTKKTEELAKAEDTVAASSAQLDEETQRLLETARAYLENTDENADAIQKLLEAHPELIEQLEAEGYVLDGLIDKTKEQEEKDQKLKERYDELGKAVSNYKSNLKELIGILENVNKGTAYSTTQILDLIEKYPELAKHIQETADGYTIQADAVRDLTRAQADNMVANAEMQLELLNSRLREANDAVNSASVIQTVTRNGRTYMGVDVAAQSAAMAEYNRVSQEVQQERQALQQQIEGYRRIADSIASGRIYSGSSSGSSSSGGSSGNSYSNSNGKSESQLAWEAQEKEDFSQLEYRYKMGEIEAEQYYDELRALGEKYYSWSAEKQDEWRNLQVKIYQGLQKLEEDRTKAHENKLKEQDEELTKTKSMIDSLRELKQAQDDLNRAEKQEVQVFSGTAGFHSEKNSQAIADARTSLADKNFALTQTLLKLGNIDGESLAERMRQIGGMSLRDLLPDLSGLTLPTVNSGSTTNNNNTNRTVNYTAGDIIVNIEGNADEATIQQIQTELKDAFDRYMSDFLDAENRTGISGGVR